MNTEHLARSVDIALNKHGGDIRSYHKDFCRRMYAASFDRYATRLKMIQYTDKNRVLDAGCGFGQWSFALADCGNKRIDACDISLDRINVFQEILTQTGRDNIHPVASPLERLPYDNGVFDCIFCYGVIHAADISAALQEFYRVLKIRGRLYFTANGLGYYVKRWLDDNSRTQDHSPKIDIARAMLSTALAEKYGSKKLPWGLIVEPKAMLALVRAAGFSTLGQEDEGHLTLGDNKDPLPFFTDNYSGLTGVYEILAEKPEA